MEKHMIWSKEEFRTPRRYEINNYFYGEDKHEKADLHDAGGLHPRCAGGLRRGKRSPVLIRPGMKFHCTECGAELEI